MVLVSWGGLPGCHPAGSEEPGVAEEAEAGKLIITCSGQFNLTDVALKETITAHELSDAEARLLLEKLNRRVGLLAVLRGNPLRASWTATALYVLILVLVLSWAYASDKLKTIVLFPSLVFSMLLIMEMYIGALSRVRPAFGGGFAFICAPAVISTGGRRPEWRNLPANEPHAHFAARCLDCAALRST